MVHHGQCLTFGLEARHHLPGIHPGLDHLQGDLASYRLGLLGHIDHAATAFTDPLHQSVAAQGLPHRVIRQLGRWTRPDPQRSVIPCERQARIWLSMGGQECLEAQSQGRVPVASAIQKSRPFPFGQSQGSDKEVCFTLWRGWQGRWRALH